jgi:regulatory protein
VGEITQMRRQLRQRSRVNVFLDGEFALALQEVLAAELHVGQTLSAEDIRELKERDAVESAYERALFYLSFRARSQAEMQRYLKKRGLDEQTAAAIIERLRSHGLVDDESFAHAWVENREAHRPRGVYSLRAELRQKGINGPIVDDAVAAVDEQASALRAAERVVERYADLDEQLFRRRLFGFLQRRGFGYDASRRVVQQLWQQTAARRETDRT